MKESIGRLGDQSAVRRLELDDAIFTYVPDGAMTVNTDAFFPAIPTQYWAEHADGLDSCQRVAMSAGGLLVQRGDYRLMIDAGMGDLTADTVAGTINCGEFLKVLSAVGVDPRDIDVFAFTHLHVDHTGWAFMQAPDARMTKTFPEARYLLSEQEWEPFSRGKSPLGAPPQETLTGPLAAVRTLIQDGYEIAPGVVAVVTPGHRAGHTSYIVTTSTGRRLVAFGDVFHTPVQLTQPDWSSGPGIDTVGVLAARARIVDELTQPNTFGFGVHFGDQPFGRVTRGSDGKPQWMPVPSTELMPAPRS
jgi:glyoxylase-like metal-dependent hydrolase (beta-lactamase superfamily II)